MRVSARLHIASRWTVEGVVRSRSLKMSVAATTKSAIQAGMLSKSMRGPM